jgi:hypothetical protein
MEKKTINSAIIIRDFPGQVSGGDCCGRLDLDIYPGDPEEDPFLRVRKIGETCGEIHLELQRRLSPDALIVQQIDPRNQISLFFLLVKEVIRYKPPLFLALKTIFMVFSLPAVIFNGRVIATGRHFQPEEVLKKIEIITRDYSLIEKVSGN